MTHVGSQRHRRGGGKDCKHQSVCVYVFVCVIISFRQFLSLFLYCNIFSPKDILPFGARCKCVLDTK
jgi:hypothetical protein